MIEFYPQILWLHMACVVASVSLFLFRGGLVQAGLGQIALSAPLRYLSYSIDSVLLMAALMLLTILPHAMFANHWLTVKLALLPVYVVLGVYAMKRGSSARVRLVCYFAALAVVTLMIGIARAHHPLGWFFPLFA